MKGPFTSYAEALENASIGEVIMARDARYSDDAWCVMTDIEATVAVASFSPGRLAGWTHWENIKELTEPNKEQLQAIESFAHRHGPDWKTILLSAWISGEDTRCEGGHLLRQVRNQLGPTWLKTFKVNH